MIHNLAKPTSNGKNCQIPFVFDEQESHLCVLSDSINQCQTSDGFSQCADGKFYQIKSPANGDSYKVNKICKTILIYRL